MKLEKAFEPRIAQMARMMKLQADARSPVSEFRTRFHAHHYPRYLHCHPLESRPHVRISGAPTARKSIAQGGAKRSPGSIVQRGQALKGRHNAGTRVAIVSPFQGWPPSETKTQGFALGYRLARRWRFGCGCAAPRNPRSIQLPNLE